MSGRKRIDAISLEVLCHAFVAIAEEMNADLIRSAYSPNIKERRDCSCAVFDSSGAMVAQADSIPVHLGAMPFSVAAAIRAQPSLWPGDVVVLNDPYAGGAHLPDVTFIAPVHVDDALIGFVANRAHHADIGGKEPGSLAGDATEIFQEGLRIPPVRLWKGGEVDTDLLELILTNVRTPQERRGDLRAQHAACVTGRERFLALVDRHGADRARVGMSAVMDYAERRMRAAIRELPDGTATFEDALDGDGVTDRSVRIRVRLTVEGDEVHADFTGSDPQAAGPINAVLAVTTSATYYAVRVLTDPEIPPNAGCYRPIRVTAARGSVLHATPPAPVVGGNLETAQRIVDVILGASSGLIPGRAIAACQGTMNNLAIGGVDPRTNEPYTFYETIGGGYGARPDKDGVDGVHSHMTNTLNTPVEALETAYPLRVERYELRAGSGGEGAFRGGLGIRRDIRIIGHTARVSLLCERRRSRPFGLSGGGPGEAGRNVVLDADGERPVAAKGTLSLAPDEVISIRTPGGGGYGNPEDRAEASRHRDLLEGRTE